MRIFFILLLCTCFLSAGAQEERDTILKRCPVYITDTVSSNNFFLEFQPSTLRVSRVKGNLNLVLQQRDQFFTIFFHEKKLDNYKYKIAMGSNKDQYVQAKYSFRSGDQVSYVDVKSGTVESTFDKEKNMWHLKVNGMIANLVERSVTYYKVRAEFWLK
ncbi:MAG TPA: hypothetical protein VLJ68_00980 [Chitinophagaceae bacterium]|nr:hypothetical protein [Chitinophagaceae bacterium]